jgi:hypothetical protein
VAERYGPKGKRRLGVTRTIQPFRSDTVQMVLLAVLRGVRTGGVPPEVARAVPLCRRNGPESRSSGGPVRAATAQSLGRSLEHGNCQSAFKNDASQWSLNRIPGGSVIAAIGGGNGEGHARSA